LLCSARFDDFPSTQIGARMIGRLIVAGSVGLVVSATGALAADLAPAPAPPPVEPAPTCDFFQAELIGVLCGHTAFVAPGVTGGNVSIDRSTFTSGPGGGTTTSHTNTQNISEGLAVAVDPWQGLRIFASTSAFQYDHSFSSAFAPNDGGAPTFYNLSRSGSIAGWQGIGAEATVWDTHMQTPFGNMRYVLNIVGNLEFFPGGGPYPDRDLQQIGWQSGAELPLGGSGLSLTYLATNVFAHISNPGVYDFENTNRLLLASEAYGWAIGPRLEGTTVLAHAAGVNTGWFETRLGGEILAEPFRLTSVPVLRDLTVDLTATHSIGQAALVPNWAGSSSQYVYSASARFNFRF
jgi:hypothetical protein